METTEITVLTGREGKEWPLKQSAEWTKNYRDKNPGAAISHFFGREILEKILAQKDCMGLRFYYAIADNGKKHLIVVGTEADGTDQLNTIEASAIRADAATTTPTQAVGQESMPCPGSPPCPKNALAGQS
jgi:hypothetical protein